MATIVTLSPSSANYSAASINYFHICINVSFSSPSTNFSHPKITKTKVSSLKIQSNNQSCVLVKDVDISPLALNKVEKYKKIQEIHCVEQYDKGIELISHQKLVIAHFSATHYNYNFKIQQFMEEQCRLSNDQVKFLYVMADKSDQTRQLCRRESIEKIPYFAFYKKTEKIHQEAGFRPEKLAGSLLYYRDDPFSPVVQLQSVKDLEKLMEVHKLDHKLIVLNVGMKQYCFPCMKLYPSVLKLAGQLGGRVVFARMNIDEINEERGCVQIMLREMEVSKVPSFLFLRNGEICGKYVGSCTTALIREIHKLQAHHTTIALISKANYSANILLN